MDGAARPKRAIAIEAISQPQYRPTPVLFFLFPVEKRGQFFCLFLCCLGGGGGGSLGEPVCCWSWLEPGVLQQSPRLLLSNSRRPPSPTAAGACSPAVFSVQREPTPGGPGSGMRPGNKCFPRQLPLWFCACARFPMPAGGLIPCCLLPKCSRRRKKSVLRDVLYQH
jgi:hypothetical protein